MKIWSLARALFTLLGYVGWVIILLYAYETLTGNYVLENIVISLLY